jgi:hypothetical protein
MSHKHEALQTSNLKVTGDCALIHGHELVQRIDVERDVLRVLNELMPFKALRERANRGLGLNPCSDASDNDARHFEETDDLGPSRMKDKGGRQEGRNRRQRGMTKRDRTPSVI